MEEEEKNTAIDEIRKHRKLNHPNIIKMLDSYKTNKGKLVMVTKFAERYDLKREIIKR